MHRCTFTYISSGLIFVLTIFLYSFSDIQAQMTDTDIKTALIYNMSVEINWSEYSSPDTFLIGIYGYDPSMKKSILKLEYEKIKNKPVIIKEFRSIHEIVKTDIIYVNNSRNSDIGRVYQIIKNTSTLMITDRHENKGEVMINFIHDEENKIRFEINTKNLDNEEITINPRLLLLGGTELDIRELYLETEKNLQLEQSRALQIENELRKKEKELEVISQKIKILLREIREKNYIISSQKVSIDSQEIKLHTITNSLIDLQKQTEDQSALLKSLNRSLHKGNKEKELLDKQLSLKNHEVETASNKLSTLHQSISKQQKILNEQTAEIQNLRRTRQITTVALFLFMLLVITILIAYRLRKKKNLKIEAQANLLKKQTLSLQKANTQLENQKSTLEKTITKLNKTQNQLVESKKMASLGQLSAGIAHEINNPITFISSSVEGLKVIIEDLMHILNEFNQITPKNVKEKLVTIAGIKKETDYEEIIEGFHELTNNIKTGADRTKDIVNSMRVFYRTNDAQSVDIDVNKVLDSTLLLINNEFKDRIKVKKNYEEIPNIKGEPGAISQAALNLLMNAAQAIKEKGTITITTKLRKKGRGKFVEIEIKDTGKGIPKIEQDKIYDPFFTTKNVGKGTGLGLYLTYNIVKKHNGEINFESIPEKGTTFSIILPI